ncbi:formin-like protein 3 isoform X2 [Thrips palmi]|nr:formin-like protein 3 isoform X2 [Thrips palmi]XP_034243218.1 formin-like protein 3 isoform X2 [Thrips palmi]
MECIVCLEPYDEGRHRPKALPCGHSLCLDCVANPQLGRKCPEDRVRFHGSADTLPDNITVLRMLTAPARPPPAPTTDHAHLEGLLQRGLASAEKVMQRVDDDLTRHGAGDWLLYQNRLQRGLQLLQASQRMPSDDVRKSLSEAARRMQDGERLLSGVDRCTVTVRDRDGVMRSADLQTGELPVCLLLRLQDGGRLVPMVQEEPRAQAPCLPAEPPPTTASSPMSSPAVSPQTSSQASPALSSPPASPTTSSVSSPPASPPMSTPPTSPQTSSTPTSTLASSPPTSPIASSPPTSPIASSPPTSPIASSPPTSPIASSPPTSPLASSPPTSPIASSPITSSPPASSPPTSPMASSPPTSPVASSPPTSPIASSPLTSPIASSPPTSPIASSPPTSPIASSPPTSPIASSPPTSPIAAPPRVTERGAVKRQGPSGARGCVKKFRFVYSLDD